MSSDAWLDYWNGDVSLYASGKHLDAHYRSLLADILPLLPAQPFTLLDYGCGEALMAPKIAEKGGRVLLYDRAHVNRARLRNRFAGQSGVRVLEDLAKAKASCDLVLMISVIQYVPQDKLPALLGELKGLLKPGGRLLIGDILPPGNSLAGDVSALLGFGLAEGFFLDAVKGLAKTLRSDYRSKRRQLGLCAYSVGEIQSILTECGFAPQPLSKNIGHAKHRRSILATLPG